MHTERRPDVAGASRNDSSASGRLVTGGAPNDRPRGRRRSGRSRRRLKWGKAASPRASPGDGPSQEPDRGDSAFVGEDLHIGEPGGVIDRHVHGFPAGLVVVVAGAAAGEPVSGLVEPGQLLHIDVHQLAGMSAAVAVGRLGRFQLGGDCGGRAVHGDDGGAAETDVVPEGRRRRPAHAGRPPCRGAGGSARRTAPGRWQRAVGLWRPGRPTGRRPTGAMTAVWGGVASSPHTVRFHDVGVYGMSRRTKMLAGSVVSVCVNAAMNPPLRTARPM
jgi:hypothetical protein